MKAFVVSQPGDARVQYWADPIARNGETLVQPLLAGVCGTDLELVDGTIDPKYVRYPLVLGHEWVGRFVTNSEGEAGPVGPLVVEGIVPCATCSACVRGTTNLCEIYDEIGFTRAGAIGELISVPQQLIHQLEADVQVEDAVMVEPMAVVWRALTRIPIRPGLRVAVIGDGTIALLAVHLIRMFEAETITVFGRRKAQIDLAHAAGANAFEMGAPTRSFDLVIEASGSVAGVNTAIEHCARGGMVILLGLPPHGSLATFAPDDLVNNDLVVQGSFSYTRESFGEVVQHVNSRELRPSFLITHRFDLADAEDALSALRAGPEDEPRGKVVIDIAGN